VETEREITTEARSSRRTARRATIIAGVAIVVAMGAAIAVEWRRFRVEIAVECLVRDRDCSLTSEWGETCQRGPFCRIEAEDYLDRTASEEPAILARHLFDDRVIRVRHGTPHHLHLVTTTVGVWLRQLAAAHRN
jgi:hypothetical protein